MKKIVLFLSIICLCGCSFKETMNVLLHESDIEDLIFNKTINEEEPKYVDDNPIEVSLYRGDINKKLYKVEDVYESTWVKKHDIIVFKAVYSSEDTIDVKTGYFQDMWYEYAENFDTYMDYKIGWEIRFSLEDGSEYHKLITKPFDTNEFYDYLEIYLYDSANVAKDTFYTHLEKVDDSTILTTMKLTAGSKYAKINSDIEVKVFTYDDNDDFDEDGFYRGKSYSIVNVSNK